MASINIDQPVTTPAHEWAANTTNALHSTTSATAQNTRTGQTSGPSTPGVDFPGAFPHDARSQAKGVTTEERTPHAAATRLADAAPPKDFQSSAAGYMPNINMQSALDTAKSYLPESVVGAVGSVLPASMTNTAQVEKNIDPTSGAKPASIGSPSSDTTSLDNASTKAIAPSTRTGSLTSDVTGGVYTPSVGQNAGIAKELDVTSQAKPATTTSDSSQIPITSTSPTSVAPVPGASSQSTSSPVNAGNTAVAMHSLPTPPTSTRSSPSDPLSSEMSPPGLGSTKTTEKDEANLPKSELASVPTPPPKDDSTYKSDDPTTSQPKVNTTPGQDHVMSGTGVGARFPGTSPVGGDGTPASVSPKSEISDPHVHGDSQKDEEHIVEQNTTATSSDEVLDDSGNGEGKKEGRVKKAVHKVKDKFSHRSH